MAYFGHRVQWRHATLLILGCFCGSVLFSARPRRDVIQLNVVKKPDKNLNPMELKRRLLLSQKKIRSMPEDRSQRHTEQEPIIVHFFLLLSTYKPSMGVSFLECISLRSVLKNLRPNRTLIHTNVPEFWPFANCAGIIQNWSSVEIVPARRKFVMQGRRFVYLAHEADVMKLEALIKYGGLALDFDVYIINGRKVRDLMRTFPCFMCDEDDVPDRLNAGFVGCKRGSRFPKLMLQRSYRDDFRPDLWLWNSGQMSFILAAEEPSLVQIVPDVCNISIPERANVLTRRDRYSWQDKIAYHTFYHDRLFTKSSLRKMNSSFGDLLKWILSNETRILGGS
ncbi:hypothetical protein BV898_10914 [Hypsibius exemplaris]|uniref:Uncharacterized protein n=1 Tax=Hypsibius exemplaris TaxID=2072580 RepID=A0A1W0WI82_HYPEX|nr:hypothetical protein BV898_10914 [Hypsibius exemplaris]